MSRDAILDNTSSSGDVEICNATGVAHVRTQTASIVPRQCSNMLRDITRCTEVDTRHVRPLCNDMLNLGRAPA